MGLGLKATFELKGNPFIKAFLTFLFIVGFNSQLEAYGISTVQSKMLP